MPGDGTARNQSEVNIRATNVRESALLDLERELVAQTQAHRSFLETMFDRFLKFVYICAAMALTGAAFFGFQSFREISTQIRSIGEARIDEMLAKADLTDKARSRVRAILADTVLNSMLSRGATESAFAPRSVDDFEYSVLEEIIANRNDKLFQKALMVARTYHSDPRVKKRIGPLAHDLLAECWTDDAAKCDPVLEVSSVKILGAIGYEPAFEMFVKRVAQSTVSRELESALLASIDATAKGRCPDALAQYLRTSVAEDDDFGSWPETKKAKLLMTNCPNVGIEELNVCNWDAPAESCLGLWMALMESLFSPSGAARVNWAWKPVREKVVRALSQPLVGMALELQWESPMERWGYDTDPPSQEFGLRVSRVERSGDTTRSFGLGEIPVGALYSELFQEIIRTAGKNVLPENRSAFFRNVLMPMLQASRIAPHARYGLAAGVGRILNMRLSVDPGAGSLSQFLVGKCATDQSHWSNPIDFTVDFVRTDGMMATVVGCSINQVIINAGIMPNCKVEVPVDVIDFDSIDWTWEYVVVGTEAQRDRFGVSQRSDDGCQWSYWCSD